MTLIKPQLKRQCMRGRMANGIDANPVPCGRSRPPESRSQRPQNRGPDGPRPKEEWELCRTLQIYILVAFAFVGRVRMILLHRLNSTSYVVALFIIYTRYIVLKKRPRTLSIPSQPIPPLFCFRSFMLMYVKNAPTPLFSGLLQGFHFSLVHLVIHNQSKTNDEP